MEWMNGRSLKSYKDTAKNQEINYKYNKDGIREEKNFNGEITKYYLENNHIIYEQRGNDTIYYLYDLTGLIGLRYQEENYYYIKNLQGDIIGILDKNYNRIVSYEYDSWGKLLSIKDEQENEITDETNIGIINPFRYREYYYDTEIGLYYLNSRYYNPVWGRFISSDKILGANSDILSYNLYLYTSNNSINNLDFSGNSIFDNIVNIVNKVKSTIKELKNSTIVEKNNLLKHPIKSIGGLISRSKAISKGKQIYGDKIDLEDSTEANAYKHAMWSAVMTYDMNYATAKMIGDAHEYGESKIAATAMDLYNNEVGRQIGQMYKNNERIAIKNSNCTFSLMIYTCSESYQSFNYLGKDFIASNSINPYDAMSSMIQHAISQGVLITSIP